MQVIEWLCPKVERRIEMPVDDDKFDWGDDETHTSASHVSSAVSPMTAPSSVAVPHTVINMGKYSNVPSEYVSTIDILLYTVGVHFISKLLDFDAYQGDSFMKYKTANVQMETEQIEFVGLLPSEEVK